MESGRFVIRSPVTPWLRGFPFGEPFVRARLFLITPRQVDLSTFPAELEAALAAGDVATLLIALEDVSAAALQRVAEVLVPIAAAHDVATLVVDDTRLIARTQAILSSLGFDAGPADGKMGRKTRDAIAAFQTSKGLPATGEIDKTLIEALGMRLI